MKHRTEGHTATTIPGHGYIRHASKFTSEVLAGLRRIGFIHHQQIIWDKQRTEWRV